MGIAAAIFARAAFARTTHDSDLVEQISAAGVMLAAFFSFVQGLMLQ